MRARTREALAVVCACVALGLPAPGGSGPTPPALDRGHPRTSPLRAPLVRAQLRGGTGLESAAQVVEQAARVRAMKQALTADPASHTAEELAAAIDRLKELKLQHTPPSAGAKGGAAAGPGKAARKKGATLEGITVAKNESFAAWYSEVVVKSELIEYYDVSGCYILRPWAYEIWERVQAALDARIKAMGVQGCYFPMFVSEKALTAEADHVEGFTPEVAWVTKTGTTNLAQPVAIRPTSETVMYPAFKKWIRSHRDLPLKLNQWCNVVRWEFKNPTPFLRTREFLWQEGHTAHASSEEADAEVYEVLDMYATVYRSLLAVPVIKGTKTEAEKFAGAAYTTTVEVYIPGSGRGIQAATSHNLGQNFANMFGIHFEDSQGAKRTVWQNSWGMTTRSIGIMIMLHADDKGLVLPPQVAPVQVVCVPVITKDCSLAQLLQYTEPLLRSLNAQGIRTKLDDAQHHSPGWKYNHWELKGVPIRIEVGPRDVVNNTVRLVRRDNGEREDVSMQDATFRVASLLSDIQSSMLARAERERDAGVVRAEDWETFARALAAKRLALSPSCSSPACEEEVGKRSKTIATTADQASERVRERVRGERSTDATRIEAQGGEEGELEEAEAEAEAEAERKTTGSAKALCIPLDQEGLAPGARCFACDLPARCIILWGRSY